MSYIIRSHKDIPVPVKIYLENRLNSRVSLTQNYVIIRLPITINNDEKNKIVNEYIIWAKHKIQQKNFYYHLTKDNMATYNNRSIILYGIEFNIKIINIIKGRNKLSYSGTHQIEIYINQSTIAADAHNKEISRLLVRFTERYFLDRVSNRLMELNQQYFEETIGKIQLKNALSTWGKCTSNRTIILSTRLLLLPIKVIDYVMIHELAHLKEMNHSKQFWAWVATAMPDYKQWDKWLTKQGHLYNF